MKKTSNIPAIIVGLILFVALFGSNYTVALPAPDYAVVYADPEKRIYYAPPYIDNMGQTKPPEPVDVKKLKRLTLKEAKSQDYRPDKSSSDKGYFEHRYRTFTSYLLEKIGLMKPLQSRWTSDGAWNW
ncbi:MAG: hypothetical protein ACOY4I_12200 [Bacillota bacterium]